MYVYYILRGVEQGQEVELEGDISEELFPGVDLTEAADVINAVAEHLKTEGTVGDWTSCDLIPSYTDLEDKYIYFNERWIRRSEVPLTNIRNEQL
jgi:hypothetical protein